MSDSNKLPSRNLVVGTAGHIDHGKTSLVRALTGIDTDRLAEEKRRGISIDLGFAHFWLPGGACVSFVDVPGHEDFVRNMLAGASGIRAVLLVVAADEGVKPQTREHFDICRLLHVETGLVALTKSDMVDSEQLSSAIQQIEALCGGSFLAGQPIVPVSAKTGAGLNDLCDALKQLALSASERSSAGLARLPIDRSFAMQGFGTVVTGTLSGGCLHIGDTVMLRPAGLEARIRGLQVRGRKVSRATVGERTAVNLSGVDHTDVSRGMILTHSNELTSTSIVDVRIEWLSSESIPDRRQHYLLHAGTAEIPVSLKKFTDGTAATNKNTLARLWLSRPSLLLPEDRFVLRRPSPAATVGGGVVLDAFPPARLNRKKLVKRLEVLDRAPWPQKLQLLVEEGAAGRRFTDLVRRTGLTQEQLRAYISENPQLTVFDDLSRVFCTSWLEGTRSKLVEWLTDFHRRHPTLQGAPLAQARLNLEAAVAKSAFKSFEGIRVEGDLIALSTHQPQVSSEYAGFLSQIENMFREAGYQPPPPAEVLHSLGPSAAQAKPILESLIKSNRLVRITNDLVFHADVLKHIQASLAAHKGRRFSIPEFKEWTQISRKYAIPLLEYLDRRHITRREGDCRVVL